MLLARPQHSELWSGDTKTPTAVGERPHFIGRKERPQRRLMPRYHSEIPSVPGSNGLVTADKKILGRGRFVLLDLGLLDLSTRKFDLAVLVLAPFLLKIHESFQVAPAIDNDTTH